MDGDRIPRNKTLERWAEKEELAKVTAEWWEEQDPRRVGSIEANGKYNVSKVVRRSRHCQKG